jgi:Domain of unknown function (DUF4405)
VNLFLLARIALDFTAVGLLFVALAYWWLGNTVHEVVGTVMFALLISHNVFNRRWWVSLPKRIGQRKGGLALASNVTVLLTMIVLLLTSLLISRTVFDFFPFRGGRTARDIHILAAYWTLVIAAIHLGLHWSMIMAVTRSHFRIGPPTFLRTTGLRIVAAAVAACGAYSSDVMGIGSRLIGRPSIDFWDFEASVSGFFLHHGAIVGLYAAMAHYARLAFLKKP